MKRPLASSLTGILALALTLGLAPDVTETASSQDSRPQLSPPQLSPPRAARSGSKEWLLDEVTRLTDELVAVRKTLAARELEFASCEREVAELRQFVRDHHVYGDDFAQYEAVRAAAATAERQRLAAENRARRQAELAERQSRQHQARAQREQENAEEARLDRYRNEGFSYLGLDVFTSQMAYAYETTDLGMPRRIDSARGLGNYIRVYPYAAPVSSTDFGRMTISGSVLNSADDVRNIGIAITFFDEFGNQVGGEIVQINNARPEVPYPFTAVIDMALDRPFASSSTYVLYADPTPPASE